MAKLIWAVIQEADLDATLDALRAHHIGVTQMGSSGGFLRKGNVTLIIGVEKARVDEAVSILREHCQTHIEVKDAPTPGDSDIAPAGGAAVFVLNLFNSTIVEPCEDPGTSPRG